MKLGISSCAYVWNFGSRTNYPQPTECFDFERLLFVASKKDLHLVQVISDIVPFHKLENSRLSSLKSLADEMKIEIEIGTQGIDVPTLSRFLEIARILGSKLIRTIIDGPYSHPSIEEGAKWIKNILPAFHELGVKLAIENHDLHTSKEFILLMDLVDDPFVGMCIDTVNSLGAQECQKQVMEALLPYAINLHYKDFTIERMDHEMGFVVNGCVAGEGLADLSYIIDQRHKAKADFNIILEQWVPYLGNIEETIKIEKDRADASIKYLKARYADLWD